MTFLFVYSDYIYLVHIIAILMDLTFVRCDKFGEKNIFYSLNDKKKHVMHACNLKYKI
jgi:hypothetical protein